MFFSISVNIQKWKEKWFGGQTLESLGLPLQQCSLERLKLIPDEKNQVLGRFFFANLLRMCVYGCGCMEEKKQWID